MRNGNVFICQFNYENNKIYFKILLEIITEVETFTKFYFYKLDNSILRLICASNEDEKLLVYDLNYENLNQEFIVALKDKKLINLNKNFDKNIIEDVVEEDKKSNGLVCVISTEDNLSFLIVALESSSKNYNIHLIYLDLIILDKENLNIELIFSNNNNYNEEVKPILCVKIIENPSNKNEYYIIMGLFDTQIKILKIDKNNIKITREKIIKEACSELKAGISSIDFYKFTNFIDDSIRNFLVTGSYDFRFRIYEISFNSKIELNYLGYNNIQKDSIIHQVQFHLDKDTNSLYLFIISDSKILLIFNII